MFHHFHPAYSTAQQNIRVFVCSLSSWRRPIVRLCIGEMVVGSDQLCQRSYCYIPWLYMNIYKVFLSPPQAFLASSLLSRWCCSLGVEFHSPIHRNLMPTTYFIIPKHHHINKCTQIQTIQSLIILQKVSIYI